MAKLLLLSVFWTQDVTSLWSATTYADNVVVALYRRASVRRAAIDRFLLLKSKFAAVARCWDRQTDGRTPCRFIDPAPSLPQIGELSTARK